ncbi:hypothetical protein SK128_004717, partial [Halocaridina rubra]
MHDTFTNSQQTIELGNFLCGDCHVLDVSEIKVIALRQSEGETPMKLTKPDPDAETVVI